MGKPQMARNCCKQFIHFGTTVTITTAITLHARNWKTGAKILHICFHIWLISTVTLWKWNWLLFSRPLFAAEY
jgi:hypothetical protein